MQVLLADRSTGRQALQVTMGLTVVKDKKVVGLQAGSAGPTGGTGDGF